MFRIKEDNSGGIKSFKILNESTGSYVSVVPGFGANVNEIVLSKGGELYSLIDGNINAEAFGGKGVFRGAKLFPFPNRVKGGTYSFEGKEYQLELNYPEENNACHGFVYNREFVLDNTEEKEDEASIKLSYDYAGSWSGYPFPFRMEIVYTLFDSHDLRCNTRVENRGETSMPLGDGWHPFFKFSGKINDLFLRLPAEKMYETDNRSIPTGRTLPYDVFSFGKKIADVTFDTCFKLAPGKDGVQTSELYDAARDLKVLLWQETGAGKYNYIQIYTPSDRKSIAIEPMSCPANAFNGGEGLITLGPEKVFEAEYGVELVQN